MYVNSQDSCFPERLRKGCDSMDNGKTMAERLLSERAVHDVRAGDVAIVPVDLVYAHDVSAPLAIKQFKETGFNSLANPDKTVLFLDHAVPSPRFEFSNDQRTVSDFAEEVDCKLYSVNEGICHQIAAEQWVNPGDVICGGDSHSPTGGALGAFATGMGSTDIAVVMGLGKTWLRVPESLLIRLKGRFPKGVCGKDLALHVVGRVGSAGATYKSLEFGGDALAGISMSDRLTVANMSVEAGAKVGLFPSDEITESYLTIQGRGRNYRPIVPDPDAKYEQILDVDVGELEPLTAVPHAVDQVVSVESVAGTKIDQVFVGSCTNGRLEDIAVLAGILDGKKRHPRTRLVIAPASRNVYREAIDKGYIQILIDAGATIVNPGCAACAGIHQGILSDGEVCLSTSNRNFKGRMGNPESFVYLASPATAAASAITGEITRPEKYLS